MITLDSNNFIESQTLFEVLENYKVVCTFIDFFSTFVCKDRKRTLEWP